MDANQSYQIRDFRVKDCSQIVDLGVALIEESENFNGPVDKSGIAQELLNGWANNDIILIAENGKNIVGILAASKYKQFFTYEHYYEERAFFVLKNFRKTHLAKDLIREYVRRVRDSGVSFANIGVGTGLKPKSLLRLYRSFGFSEKCHIATRRF
jgi:GNAT superfamily N-acetyltransferase